METLKLQEAVTITLETAEAVGHFVVERLKGGAWSDLAEQIYPTPEL